METGGGDGSETRISNGRRLELICVTINYTSVMCKVINTLKHLGE